MDNTTEIIQLRIKVALLEGRLNNLQSALMDVVQYEKQSRQEINDLIQKIKEEEEGIAKEAAAKLVQAIEQSKDIIKQEVIDEINNTTIY